jgi:hypothetical protein
MIRMPLPEPLAPPEQGDAWFESEPRTYRGAIAELQRIQRRTLNRPWPVIALAALVTSVITYRVAKRSPLVEAEVVISISEGALADRSNVMPNDELIGYISSVLIPDQAVAALIEKRNLYPSRKRMGMEYAIGELREQLEINTYRNTFLYFDDNDVDALRSVRIGLTITDLDPDRAFELAKDFANIIIETSDSRRRQIAETVTREVGELRAGLEQRLDDINAALAKKQVALTEAIKTGDDSAVGALDLDIRALGNDQLGFEEALSKVVGSRDSIADRITAAGLDNTVQIVEERRPARPEKPVYIVAMVAVIVGAMAFIGSALVVGAFDSRIHDSDDVERLGLPILGHVPGFPGDHVGSLGARGATRARVPSWLRWRSHR